MNRLGKWLSACLAALALLTPPAAAPARAGGRLSGKHSWYRVYYRDCCDGAWKYYGTYCELCAAREVVAFLRVEGCDAYFRPI